MRAEVYICDICSVRKEESNHWVLALTGAVVFAPVEDSGAGRIFPSLGRESRPFLWLYEAPLRHRMRQQAFIANS